MSTPWAQSCQLTSTSQFSTPIALDPLAKSTTVLLSFASSGALGGGEATMSAYVQATCDVAGGAFGGAGVQAPTPAPIWSQVGSSLYQISSAGTVVNVSSWDGGAMFVLLQPVSGLRLASSAAGGVGGAGIVYLRALQSPTA